MEICLYCHLQLYVFNLYPRILPQNFEARILYVLWPQRRKTILCYLIFCHLHLLMTWNILQLWKGLFTPEMEFLRMWATNWLKNKMLSVFCRKWRVNHKFTLNSLSCIQICLFRHYCVHPIFKQCIEEICRLIFHRI